MLKRTTTRAKLWGLDKSKELLYIITFVLMHCEINKKTNN